MLYHNKKRNVGLLSEFFAKYMASALVEQKFDNIQKASSLHKKYFLNPSCEIAKEWKVYRALYETTLSSRESARTLMERSRTFCETLSSQLLEQEKTKLIHEINNVLGDKDFFKRQVSDYKLQASIQVLINGWKEKTLTESLGETASVEDIVLEHLTRNAAATKNLLEESKQYLEMDSGQMTNEIDSLVVNIMSEKFNGKFREDLEEEQRKLISQYVFSEVNQSTKESLTAELNAIKENVLGLINYSLENKKIGKEDLTEHLSKKFVGIKNLLLNEYRDTSSPNDNSIIFYMTLVKLKKEITND